MAVIPPVVLSLTLRLRSGQGNVEQADERQARRKRTGLFGPAQHGPGTPARISAAGASCPRDSPSAGGYAVPPPICGAAKREQSTILDGGERTMEDLGAERIGIRSHAVGGSDGIVLDRSPACLPNARPRPPDRSGTATRTTCVSS